MFHVYDIADVNMTSIDLFVRVYDREKKKND